MEEITCNPWDEATAPERILIIRLHAIGDVAITLPLCAALRKMLPDTRIDFLTGQQSRDLPEELSLFDTVHVFPDSRSLWARAVHAVRSGAALAKIRYDLVMIGACRFSESPDSPSFAADQ